MFLQELCYQGYRLKVIDTQIMDISSCQAYFCIAFSSRICSQQLPYRSAKTNFFVYCD